MELIINISEQEHNECKNLFNMIYQEGYLNYNLNTALIMYIANGIPLPKGHGRLVDMNVALKVLADEWGYEGIEDDLEYKVPTIIKADKENNK